MPAVLSYEIMSDMGVGATVFSFIGACFYYGYIFMQIPIGMLCDQFGPKNYWFSVALCSISTFIFAYTKIVALSALSRFIIGIASASAFIAPLTLATKWYDKRYFALIAGVVQLLGCLGAILGGAPIALIAAKMGWRETIIYSGLIGLVFVFCMCYSFKIALTKTQKNPKKSMTGKRF